MVYHICKDCEEKFIAISYKEAREAAKAALQFSTEMEDEDEDLTYARFCPYCGSLDVEVVQDEEA